MASLKAIRVLLVTLMMGLSACSSAPPSTVNVPQVTESHVQKYDLQTVNSQNAHLFNAQGLRIRQYRAPVPSGVPGAETLTDQSFLSLVDQGKLLLIDVLPAPLRHGHFINTEGHKVIPNSFWLPNTGKGDASEVIDQYFADHLHRLKRQYPDRIPVFYCKTDCWMSWNATLKALRLGISPVYWYPAGVDGWIAAGRSLIIQKAEPLYAK